MRKRLLSHQLLELADDQLNILSTGDRCNQHCVLGLDDDLVFYPQGRNESALGMDIAVTDIFQYCISVDDIEALVLFTHFME